MKTVAAVRVAARVAPAGFIFPMPNPPIRQAQRPAVTQKIAHSFLRLLSIFAATDLLERLQLFPGVLSRWNSPS
jgi:hypothetical protein